MVTTIDKPVAIDLNRAADEVENIRAKLGNDAVIHQAKVNDFSEMFQRGVMATCRVTAERFNFTMKLSDLGIVPTNSQRRDKVLASIDSVLKNSQRGSLLPRDAMWYEEGGKRIRIIPPSETERLIRKMFPTRYEGQDTRYIADGRYASWLAVPANGSTFIPFSSWDAWQKEFQDARAKHLRSAELIVENYDRIKAASLRHYSEIALDVYTRLEKTAPEYLRNKDGQTQTLLQWLRSWRRLINGVWPTKDEILRRYTVEEKFFWAPKQPQSMIDEKVMRYIQEMDGMDWTGRDEEYKEWVAQRGRMIEQLWREVEWADQFIQSNDEKLAMMSIARVIARTENSEAHELSVSYVKSIVERVESVFLTFLSSVRENEMAISSTQINTILKVTEMIRSMGSGVDSLQNIVSQAEKIEDYISTNLDEVKKAQAKQRSVRKNTGAALAELPTIIANATQIIRQEAESVVGHDARRTFLSAEDPVVLLDEILSHGHKGQSRLVRRVTRNETTSAAPAEIPLPPPPSIPNLEDDDEFAVVRRLRPAAAMP